MDGSVDSIREALLNGNALYLDKRTGVSGIFEHVETFVSLTRGNKSVREVILFLPLTDSGDDTPGTHRYAIWERVAEGIGNLQALLHVYIHQSHDDEEGEAFAPDWEILACILRRLQRGIRLNVEGAGLRHAEALPDFARVIYGQAMITGISIVSDYDCLETLCSTFLTLPALENVTFGCVGGQDTQEGHYESMALLLRSSVLRLVRFTEIAFSISLCLALKEGSRFTDLQFRGCTFPDDGGALIASMLATNTTLKCLKFESDGSRVDHKVIYDLLATALLSNSTLQELAFDLPGRKCSWLSPLFLALQVNTGLKKLRIAFSLFSFFVIPPNFADYDTFLTRIDEELSAAMRLGLGRNSTLESLTLSNIKSGGNDISLWREAFSSLYTNTALKALHMHFEPNGTESHVTAIRMEVLAALHDNKSLETLSMTSQHARFDDYLACVAAIQPNTPLKSFQLHPLRGADFYMDQDETKALFVVLKKNYWLEAIPRLRQDGAGDIRSILQLNAAGRRYLVQDGSSISKGVDVLSNVSNDINSLFLHLLENPRLCDRSAVETSDSRSSDNAGSSSPANHSGDSGGGE
jgi:hypothetical protein